MKIRNLITVYKHEKSSQSHSVHYLRPNLDLGLMQQSIPFSIKESSHYERLIMYLFIKPIMYYIVFRKLAARNIYCRDEW
jgi:hypothetical protein